MTKTDACARCRWWERSNNARKIAADWGLCHFWGGRSGHGVAGIGFIDYSYGHEPRGGDTCGAFNADPTLRGTIPKALSPKPKCEGVYP